MLDELVKDGGSSGLDRLLFGPVFLVSEFVSSVVPGLILFGLLVFKGNHVGLGLFQSNLVGYRTKLFIVLFAAFVAGKILSIPYGIVQAGVRKTVSSEMEKLGLNDHVFYMILGAVVLPGFLGKSKMIEHVTMIQAGNHFSLSSGIAFLIASAVPGDGNWRILEVVVGVLFLISAIFQIRATSLALAAFTGVAIGEFIEKIGADRLPGYMKAGLAAYTAYASSKAKSAAAAATPPPPTTPPSVPGEPPKAPLPE